MSAAVLVVAEATTPSRLGSRCTLLAGYTKWLGPHANSPDLTRRLMVCLSSDTAWPVSPSFLAITAGLMGW